MCWKRKAKSSFWSSENWKYFQQSLVFLSFFFSQSVFHHHMFPHLALCICPLAKCSFLLFLLPSPILAFRSTSAFCASECWKEDELGRDNFPEILIVLTPTLIFQGLGFDIVSDLNRFEFDGSSSVSIALMIYPPWYKKLPMTLGCWYSFIKLWITALIQFLVHEVTLLEVGPFSVL